VLNASSDQLRHALALGFNRCGGSFQSHIDGSLAVRLQQGLAAETGVDCAQLAQRGFTGPVNFLEGRYGFTHLYARGLCAPAAFVDGLGSEWRLTQFMFKRFPSCGVTQGVTQQALDVTAELDLQPDDVAQVTVRLPPYAHQLVGNPFCPGANPRVSAQFSVQYCVANAIVRRGASLEHFRPEMVTAAELLPLTTRIEVIADPELDRRGHSAVDFELRTADGRRANRSYDISPGYPGNDLGPAEHRARFVDCMAYAPYPLTEDQIARLTDAVELEAYPDVRVLLDALVSADSGRVR
jgi:2-methylcitrate dehydratase PrpD